MMDLLQTSVPSAVDRKSGNSFEATLKIIISRLDCPWSVSFAQLGSLYCSVMPTRQTQFHAFALSSFIVAPNSLIVGSLLTFKMFSKLFQNWTQPPM